MSSHPPPAPDPYTINCLTYDGTYIYAGTPKDASTGTGGTVYQINPTTMTIVASVIIAGNVSSLTYDGTYIYAGMTGTTAGTVIYKIDPATMTTIGSITASSQTGSCTLITDLSYVYCYDAISTLHKINTDNMSVIASVSLVYSGASATGQCLTYDGTYIYAGGNGQDSGASWDQLFKVNPSSMSIVTQIQYNVDASEQIRSLTFDGTYVYAIDFQNSTGYPQIYAIQTSDLSAVNGSGQYSTVIVSPTPQSLYFYDGYLYTALQGWALVQWDPSTLNTNIISSVTGQVSIPLSLKYGVSWAFPS